MSEDSKGIIIGAVSVAEVDGFPRAKFGFDTKVRINSNDYAIIQFLDPVRGEHRSLHLFDGQSVGDDRDVYDGPRTDRKRVVSGKSVSVRVDLGGRRIVQKQIQEKKRWIKY